MGGDLLRFGKPIPIAKITLPVCAQAFGRERLFQLLETSQKNPVTWIVAPAGFGKTTLAASYLTERKIPCMWYCLDERDSDTAVFFHFMSHAVTMASPKKDMRLPHQPPKGLTTDPAFALSYFASLCDRLPEMSKKEPV